MSEVLPKLLELEDGQFEILVADISGPLAFNDSDSRVESLSDLIGLSPHVVRDILQFTSFVYRQIHGEEKVDSNVKEIVSEFLSLRFVGEVIDATSETNVPVAKTEDRLARLVTYNINCSRFLKIERLRRGFGDEATTFETIVDLRPCFSSSRESIEALIPVIQLRIATAREGSAKKAFVCQLHRRELLELQRVVDTALKKLDSVRADSHIREWLVE